MKTTPREPKVRRLQLRVQGSWLLGQINTVELSEGGYLVTAAFTDCERQFV